MNWKRLSFRLICLVILTFLVGLEFQKYLENHDVSATTYKSFKHHKQDVYPTFSFCIVSYSGRLFEGVLGNFTTFYWKFLVGKTDDENKINVNLFNTIDYDDVVIDLKSVVQRYKRKTKIVGGRFQTETFFDFDKSFEVIYQDPNRICLTRKAIDSERRIFKYDLVELNATWLHGDRSEGHAYIHQKGQLIRSLTKPAFTLFGNQLHRGKLKNHRGFQYAIKMRNNAIEVLRKRSNSVEKCDDTLMDDNSRWRKTFIEKIQCLPTYMKRFTDATDLKNNLQRLPKCNLIQYGIIDKFFGPYDDFEATSKFYTGPCTQMSSLVTTIESLKHFEDTNDTSIILKFEYETRYKETINKRAFQVSDLLSQMGGIIGVILGYSLLQVPETIIQLWNLFSHV